jgi:S1-C subfamily serine protease
LKKREFPPQALEETSMKPLILSNSRTIALLGSLFLFIGGAFAQESVPLPSQMTTEWARRTANIAIPSVFKVLIPGKSRNGTAFLHKGGSLITASHVVGDATVRDVALINSRGEKFGVKKIVNDPDHDLALLAPDAKINASSLPLSPTDRFAVGLPVSSWGYPSGYRGKKPLFVSGYLSGIDMVDTKDGRSTARWVVNAAFNNGNSGGPLVDIERGEVIGVVSSKLAPLPREVEDALSALKNQKSNFIFERKLPDGTRVTLSEAQVIEFVLEYLRSQTQLVIGYAVTIVDLRTFLTSRGIAP